VEAHDTFIRLRMIKIKLYQRSIHMKTLATIICAAFLALVFAGCCTTSKEIYSKCQSERAGVFADIKPGEPIHEGFADLLIKVNIKTPRAGYYLFESKSALHGKPEYPFIFNIGGQCITWMAKGKPDTQERIVDSKRNPEGGEGVKYTLEKRIILKPGTYKVSLGLTEEKFRKEITINIIQGKTSILEFTPVYQTDRISGQTFYRGIHDFRVSFDERELD
jgi:hypothetical protein